MPSLKELVATYNTAATTQGEKAVTKFPDRATAERRVAALLARLRPSRGPFARVPAPSRSSRRRERAPSAPAALGSCSAPGGGSYAELEAEVRAHSEVGNVAQRIRDIIGLAHKAHGYGIEPSADGQRVQAIA